MLHRHTHGYRLLILLAALHLAQADVVSLDSSNFDDVVLGGDKGAFIKFFAPWCGHCKAMAPAWEQLGEHFDDSETVVIAEVDCTAENAKKLCETHGIRGFPSLKFTGASGQLEDYSGGRDFDALSEFATANVAPPCQLEKPEQCSKEQLDFIAEWKESSQDDRDKEIAFLEKKISVAQAEHEALLGSLQSQFDASQKKLGATKAELTGKITLLSLLKESAKAEEAKAEL